MKRFTIVTVLSILAALPAPALAARLYLLPTRTTVQAGHSFTAELRLDTQGDSINALDIHVQYDASLLQFASASDASSLVNIWLEHPLATAAGTITMSGVSPGGFAGDGVIAQLTFVGLRSGNAPLAIANDSRVLLDRSDGKSSFVLTNNSAIAITDTAVDAPQIAAATITLPEPIVVSLDRSPIGHNDLWFVSFAAQDKGSGIKEVSVRERLLGLFAGEWRTAQSPYILENQNLLSTITIRAVNYAGQSRETTVVPTRLKILYAVVTFVGFTALLFVAARPLVRRLPRIRV